MDRDEVIALARKFDMRKGRRPRGTITPTPVFATKKDVEAAARLYDERLARASAYARARRRSGRGHQSAEWDDALAHPDEAHGVHQQDVAVSHGQPVNHFQAGSTAHHHTQQFIPHHAEAHDVPYHEHAHMQSVHSQALGTHSVAVHPHQAVAHSQQLAVHDVQALAHAQPPRMHAQDMVQLPQQHLATMQDVDAHSHLVQSNSQGVEAHNQGLHTHGQHAVMHPQRPVAHPDEVVNGYVQVTVGHPRVAVQHVEDMSNQAMHVVENAQDANSLAQVRADRAVNGAVDVMTHDVDQHRDRYQQETVPHQGHVEGYTQQGENYRQSDEAYRDAETYAQDSEAYQQQGETYQQVVGNYAQESEVYHQNGETEQQRLERYQQEVEELQCEVVKDQQVIESHEQENGVQPNGDAFVQPVGTHHVVNESRHPDAVPYHIDVEKVARQGDVIETHDQNGVTHQTEEGNRELTTELHAENNDKDSQFVISEGEVAGPLPEGALIHNQQTQDESVQQAEADVLDAQDIEISTQHLVGTENEGVTGSDETVRNERQLEPTTEWGKEKGSGISASPLVEELELTLKADQADGVENQTRSTVESLTAADQTNGLTAGEIADEMSADGDRTCAYDSDVAAVNGDRAESGNALCMDGNAYNCAEEDNENSEKLVFDGGTRVDGATAGASKRSFDEVDGIEDAQSAIGTARKKVKCSDVAVDIV